MRTQDEIVARIDERKQGDPFGFEWHEYFTMGLDFAHAQPFFGKDAEVDEEGWDDPLTDDQIHAKMEAYMPFAWDKANNCRGISASRSVQHYVAWLWMVGEDELAAWCADDVANYEHYGKEILIRICEHFGWDWEQWDDGVRRNTDY